MSRTGHKQCDECGHNKFDTEGWGKDKYGEYTIYICDDCGTELKIYDNE